MRRSNTSKYKLSQKTHEIRGGSVAGEVRCEARITKGLASCTLRERVMVLLGAHGLSLVSMVDNGAEKKGFC